MNAGTLQNSSHKHYMSFVEALVKPGGTIKQELTALDAHRLHMAIGAVGELLELLAGLWVGDDENILEETGDILFYLQGLSSYPIPNEILPVASDIHNPAVLVAAVSNVVDTIKKVTIYRKRAAEPQIQLAVNTAIHELAMFARRRGWSIAQVMQANMVKLSERYPTTPGTAELAYSDAAAVARADKPAGE